MTEVGGSQGSSNLMQYVLVNVFAGLALKAVPLTVMQYVPGTQVLFSYSVEVHEIDVVGGPSGHSFESPTQTPHTSGFAQKLLLILGSSQAIVTPVGAVIESHSYLTVH